MQEATTTKVEGTIKPKFLIQTGHFHHQAACDCKTAVCVESYYEQIPPLICPSCKKTVRTMFTYEEGQFIAENLHKCEFCHATFDITPVPPEPVCCPVCAKPAGGSHVEKTVAQAR